MKILKSVLSLGLVAVSSTLALQSLFAQPTGSITNLITDPANAVWDFSMLSNELQNVDYSIFKVKGGVTNTEAELIYADPFTQTGAGKFTGSGSTPVTLLLSDGSSSNSPFTGTYKVSGSVTSSKGVAKIAFTARVAGATEVDGKNRNVSSSVTFNIEVGAVSGQVGGREAARASAAGLGTISSSTTIGPYPLTNFVAEVGDGTWTLVLTFGSSSGAALNGTATVTLDSGTVYPFNFTGTYSAHTTESKLNLKGTSNAAGSVLQVTLNSSNQVSQITGHIAGQTVKLSD